MKKKLLLAILLFCSVMTYSQTEHNITSKPLKVFNTNDFDIDTVSINRTSFFISKKHIRLFKRLKRKQQSSKTLRKVIASIFGKKHTTEHYKLKHRVNFFSFKRKNTNKGFHLVDGIHDIVSTMPSVFSPPFALSLKVLYGYQLETNHIHISSYPGINILPYRVPQKQTLAGNALKDLIIGFKIDIDFKL